jgi:hypothetical protein
MSKALEEGLIVISAFLFWQRRLTIILMPFHFAPSLIMSSPTFLGFSHMILFVNITRPRGPSFGARVDAGPGSPPNTLISTKDDGEEIEITESDFVWVDFRRHRNLKKISNKDFFFPTISI